MIAIAGAQASVQRRPSIGNSKLHRLVIGIDLGLLLVVLPERLDGRARRAVLVTALCAGASLAHAQQLSSIESLNESYVACVQSAFVRRLDDFGVSNLPEATECAFIDCQLEEDALFTTAAASAPGDTQAIALVRAAIEQLKAKLKAKLLASPPTMPPKE
jgi:hypothetical protein